MSFFSKLFGKKPSPAAAAPAPADPSKDPNMIRVFDAYGREMFITKQAWRDSVLLDHIKKVWNDPNALYDAIVQALHDGFGSDMVKPAEQLAAIDPNAERGAVILGVVYREQKRFADSDKVLRRHIARHGESGVILTNLAKVQTDQGNAALALQTLWHGLELDPNQDNGLGWYEVIHREKEGVEAGQAALRRIAALPGAWRARLWLARNALSRRQLEEALSFYSEALAMAPRPVPPDLLQQLSGDLGNHGHLPEILRLVTPLFDVTQHGLAVGNNLIKANLDLGRLDAARVLIDQHYAQKRPDWKDTLSFWDTELAKSHVASTPASSDEKMTTTLLAINGPVWLPDQSPIGELFPVPTGELVHVAFLGSTAETSTSGDKPIHQMSDTPGRVSRAVPLFLAEQVRFGGDAQVRTIVPWLLGSAPAFILSGVPWPDDDAAQHGRTGTPACDYVVVTHLKAVGALWQIELRLIRTIDAKLLGTATASFHAAQPETPLLQLAQDLLQLLAANADLKRNKPPQIYRVPPVNDFPYYLLRLEQLLAVRCSTMDGTPSVFLNGVREIIDGNLQLCLNQPDNSIPRIVLVQTLLRLKKNESSAVEEFRGKVLLLQKEKPLGEPAQAVLDRLIQEIYA